MTKIATATSQMKLPSRSSARNAEAKSDFGFPLPLDTPPIEARSSEELPDSDGPWQYEPKWDGFRCLAFKSGHMVDLRAKSGKPLGRYFPEVTALLREVAAPQFVVDGELVMELNGRLAFDALQMRLHPAESRIRKLAAATPARLMLFDMLVAPEGTVLLDMTLRDRRKILETFMKKAAVPKRLLLSPRTTDRSKAAQWLTEAGNGGTDGVMAKRLDDSYTPGERTNDQGEAIADGGLRCRRVSLCEQEPTSQFIAAGTLRCCWQARSRRLYLDDRPLSTRRLWVSSPSPRDTTIPSGCRSSQDRSARSISAARLASEPRGSPKWRAKS
jgi:hypothetical protein